MALPSCFQPALPQLPTPLPYKSWRLRAELEAEESQPTRRQCRGAVWRHRQTVESSCRGALRQCRLKRSCLEALGQCSGAIRHAGSSRGPDHRASPTLMADLQKLQQQDPVLRPVLVASTAKPSNMKERSTRALVQQYPRRFLKNGILRRGQADQRRVTLGQLVLPSSLWTDVQERSGTASATGALWYHALGKREGIWCLVWSFGNALCLYVNGLP